MYTRVMGVGVTTFLLSGIKLIGDLEQMNKISIPAIVIAILGAIIILVTRKGCEIELEENYQHRDSRNDASYPCYLKRK